MFLARQRLFTVKINIRLSVDHPSCASHSQTKTKTDPLFEHHEHFHDQLGNFKEITRRQDQDCVEVPEFLFKAEEEGKAHSAGCCEILG